MNESITILLKYIEGNTGPYTKCVPHFVKFQLLVGMNEVLQIAKIVLSLEQCAFIVKKML